MAKRKKTSVRSPYQTCMSKQIPIQRKKKMQDFGKRKLTRKQHNDAFAKAVAVCTR